MQCEQTPVFHLKYTLCHFPLSTTTTCRFFILLTGHLLSTHDSEAAQCIFIVNKTQWTKWILSLWEQAAGSTCLSATLRLGFLLHTINLKTFNDLQTHPSIPVHTEEPKLDNKLRVLQNLLNYGMNLFLKKNISNSSPAGFLQMHVPFPVHDVQITLSTLPTFSLLPAQSRHWVVLSKSQNCKIHMVSSGNVNMWM